MKLSITSFVLLLLANVSLQTNAELNDQIGLANNDVADNIYPSMDEDLFENLNFADSLAEIDSISATEHPKVPMKEFEAYQTEQMHIAALKRKLLEKVFQDFDDYDKKKGTMLHEQVKSLGGRNTNNLTGSSTRKLSRSVGGNLLKPRINRKALDFERKVGKTKLFANINDEPPNSDLRILYDEIVNIDNKEILNNKRFQKYDHIGVPIRAELYYKQKNELLKKYQNLISEFKGQS